MKVRTIRFASAWTAAMIAGAGAIVVRGDQSYSFFTLTPGYAEHVFGITSSFMAPRPKKGYLGGVAVLQSGDVIAAECLTNGTRLHRFSAAPPTLDPATGLYLHAE